jgi:hypothetical protein
MIFIARDGNTYRGDWHFCERTCQWIGNPALCAEVQDILKSISNRAAADGGERTHSAAMTYGLLEKMIDWSNRACPYDPPVAATTLLDPAKFGLRSAEEEIFQTQHICFRAFASLAWTLWTR